MATCLSCENIIVFGGVREGSDRFCNQHCRKRGAVELVAREIPGDLVEEQVFETYNGLCPCCGGDGPVDVHTSYRVWSALVFTRTRAIPSVCCSRCARSKFLKNTVLTFLFGWWGFPNGLLLTPVFLVKNIVSSMRLNDDRHGPSQALEQAVRMRMAEEVDRSAPGAELTRVP